MAHFIVEYTHNIAPDANIPALLRNDVILIDEVGFAPLDETGTQLLFRLVAAAYERRSLGLASHWPFEDWGTFLRAFVLAVYALAAASVPIAAAWYAARASS